MLPSTETPAQKTSAEVCAPRWQRAPLLLCELVVLLWVAHDFLLQAMAMPQRIAAPFQFDYEEGNILNALARITHRLSPYPDPHAFPNVLNPYGPVAYYLLAVPVKLFGLSFAPPRVVIVASVAAICVLLALITVKLGGSRLAAIAFALIYPTLAVAAEWTWLLRVDFLALAFSLAGLYLFCRRFVTEDTEDAEKVPSVFRQAADSSGVLDAIVNRQSSIGNSSASSGTKPRLILPALLFVAALFVKYTFLAAPAACVLYLLIQRRWREAGRLMAIGAALSGAALAIAAGLTRGTVLTHLFLSHPDPFSWAQYGQQMSWVIADNRVLVVLAAVYLISGLRARRISVPMLWLLAATATAITAGKLGSNSNHLLEWSAALCLCTGLGFSALVRLRPPQFAVAATLAATIWIAVFMITREQPSDPMEDVKDCPQLYAYVRQAASDRILSENVGALVLAGKPVWVSNPFVYTQLVVRRGWPDMGMQRMVERGEFDLIVTDRNYPAYPMYMKDGTDRFSPVVVQAMAKHYHVAATFDCGDASYVMEKR